MLYSIECWVVKKQHILKTSIAEMTKGWLLLLSVDRRLFTYVAVSHLISYIGCIYKYMLAFCICRFYII